MFNSKAPLFKQETILDALALGGTGVIVLDPASRIEWMSQLVIDLFGIELASLEKGMNWSELIQIDGESVWTDDLEEVYHSQGCLDIEGYCDSPTKGRIALHLAMQQDTSSGNRIVLIRDITFRKDREDELEAEKQNAQQLNLALETEIQKANELAVLAERANIAKSVFLTSMSHEFRTPLNGVLGYAQMLGREKELSSKNKKAVKTIEKCGRHLLSIINDVLDLSKVESGKVEVSTENVSVSRLIIDVVDVFKVRAQNKGIELLCRLDDHLSGNQSFVLDEKLIRQVMINLIGNAIKFTDSGQIVVEVRIKKMTSKRAKLDFSVTDTGAGIDRDDAKQIFEEFYQTEAFSGHKGGTGLGLAISQKLMKAMGSEIRVKSKIGEGSCFYFEIDCKVAENAVETKGELEEAPYFTCSDSSAVYVQTYPKEKNESVLTEVFEKLGINTLLERSCGKELKKFTDNSVSPLFVGISLSDVFESGVDTYFRIIERGGSNLFWIVYVDDNRFEASDLIEKLRSYSSVVLCYVPVDVRVLLNKLYHLNEQLWIVEDDKHTVLPEAEKTLSAIIPDLQTIKQMQFDAQIGDMRAFTKRLNDWEASLGESTLFGQNAANLVEAFKIDDLCRYLEETAKKVDV